MTAYDLADRFRSGAPPTLLTGVQAIVRLLVEQRALDARRGRDVGFFVSGYQGSPLGGLDKMLAGEPELLRANAIHFQPGLNEEIAATGVWGSQTDLPTGRRRHDGVVGVWYGKAPGVDRATDALRHLTMYGVDPTGGVVLLAGDDPAAKSSTVPAVSADAIASWYYEHGARAPQRRLPPAERVGTNEVQLGLDEGEALAESARCFSCGTCIDCDNCVVVCPDLAVQRLAAPLADGAAAVRYEVLLDYCKGCGLCVRECPTGSMTMEEDRR